VEDGIVIAITGGLGFIGSHTARALIDSGETCVLIQRSQRPIPSFLQDAVGRRIVIETLDVMDRGALLAVGRRHTITGIVHLSSAGFAPLFDGFRADMVSVANVLEAAAKWQVGRVSLASSLGVYTGMQQGSWREDLPLPLTAPHLIAASKKAIEAFGSCVNGQIGIDCICVRIGGIFGPRQRPRNIPGVLTQAAVKGAPPDLAACLFSTHPDDGYDHCYVKDCARGIALLQMAASLKHRVYNVASGRFTSNREIVEAIKRAVPNASVELPGGNESKATPIAAYQDISRLHEDTGYVPLFTLDTAIADYVAWLRSGNEL
jgi:UDP-glucose 4-epimerase